MQTHKPRTIRCERRGAGRAFSLLEVVVVIVILGVALAIFLPSLVQSRRSVQTGVCLSQLRSLGVGLRQYALANGGLLPDPAVTGVSWARSIQRHVTDQSAFVCPSDNEVAPVAGCSYDWRDTGDPATTMAGRSLDKVNRTNAVLVFDSLPDWHAPKKINIARLDGSSHTVDAAECFKDLLLPVRAVDEASLNTSHKP